MTAEPRWRRRKADRPGEIVGAALAVFSERGFAAARIEEIAARAGVSKGAIYLYFETKEALFRAVVTEAVRPNVARVIDMAEAWKGSFADLARIILPAVARLAATLPVGAVIKMVIGESRNFPELAKVWHDEVVQPALATVTRLIADAQARGEIRPGNPRIHAFSLLAPMLIGVIWRETFTPVGGAEVDLAAVAAQHVETALAGLGDAEMKPQRIVVLVLALLALGFLGWRLLAPQFRPAQTLSGYIEGEALYLASPVSGSVARVSVQRGQRVAAGTPLFAVEPEQQAAQGAEAAAQLGAALAQAQDVRKGQRPAELGVYTAELAAAQAQERETRAMLARVEPLVARGFYARARLDDAKAAHDAAAAQVRAARQRYEAATLGARDDQIRAADARVEQAQAALRQTTARTASQSPSAPGAGRVEDVFFQAGEYAAANQPILSLIPDDRVFVRFFVPEGQVARYRPGIRVRFACDGCPAGLTAVISFVNPRPEFTPPVIYSRESRDRLVFLIEARPEGDVTRLNPGLPVDVVPL